MGVDLVAMAQVPQDEGEPVLELLRELAPGELPPSPSAKPPAIKTLRHTHHLAARLIAEGRKQVEVSAITGYSQSRLSILKNDPAFAELVSFYAAQAREVYVTVHGKLAALGEACADELLNRLEEKPESFSHNQIREVMESTLDRSVAPKKGAAAPVGGPGGVVVNVSFQAPEAPQGPILDIKAEPKSDG